MVGDHRNPAPTFKMHSRPSPTPLTHLTICSFPISTFDINWDNLTFLKMSPTMFDGCIEVIKQAPLLEICSITLPRMEFLPIIPKIIVRHLRLRTLMLFHFPFQLLCSFLDVLELPSLQAYLHQVSGHDIAVDNVISLLDRSATVLKQLTLDMHSPRLGMDDLKNLLNAVPCLHILHLNFGYRNTTNVPVIRELFELLVSSSPPIGILLDFFLAFNL